MIEPNQSRLDRFDNLNKNRETFYRAHLDAEKRITSTRTMLMHANGFRDKHVENINQMIEFCKVNKIEVAMLNETNWKCATRTIDAMSSK